MAKYSATILIIDDDEDVLTSLSMYLKLHFEKVLTSQTPQRINELVSENEISLVLLDMNFRKGMNDGMEGLYWLEYIKEVRPATAVVLITAYGNIELAVESLKKGASDFLVKPWNNQKLLKTLQRALELNKARPAKKAKAAREKPLPEANPHLLMQPDSRRMKEVLRIAEKVAATDANILILGENGTGKEVMARYIHEKSERAGKPFIPLDLGAINENLFEAELFGYRKGAFTDAREDKPGRFEMAKSGTLFLDEIGNIPPGLQSKLLSAIQTKTISPVGSTVTISINCWIICATNVDLHTAVSEGKFRQDLLFRINTIELELPPLRDRTEDIPALAQHFLQQFNRQYNKHVHLSEQAVLALMDYPWPGNIRELQHVMERSVILADEDQLKTDDLNLSDPVDDLEDDDPATLDLEEMEKRHIRRILKKYRGNISHAAKALKINRNTLYRKIEKYGL